MKTTVYWFSGTGNSLHLAKAICGGLEDAELVPAARALEDELEPAEITGLVFPVYAWGPPVMIRRLIERLPADPPRYMFAAATCGGSPGSAMKLTGKMLRKRGLPLHSTWSVRMVENYPAMGGAPPEEKQRRINAEAEEQIAGIVQGIRDRVPGDFGRKSPFFSFIGPLVYPLFARFAGRAAAKFRADDRCTSCGICARICPSGNVMVPDCGRPVWGDSCEQCFACFHWCPVKAVQFGKKSSSQPRYHHPGVSLADMTGGVE
jgi:ferredoxin